MHQWLIDIPALGWSLRTSHVLLLCAVVVCSWDGARRLRALNPRGWTRARWGWVLLAVAPWLGGHLHFLLDNWRYATTSPLLLLIPWNGLHAGGAMIAFTLTASLVVRRYRLSLGHVADALVPTIGVGIILGRLGCFAEGCCCGRVCQWPWCVSFPKETYLYELHLAQRYITPDAAHSAPVHPLQLYFAGVGVVLIVLSHYLHPPRRYDGQVALMALVIFSVAAAALEQLRAEDDARVYWGALPQLQWTALGMSVVSVAVLTVAERKTRSDLPLPRGDPDG